MVFGIVGYGRFGSLWADALLPFGEVLVHDNQSMPKSVEKIRFTTLKAVAKADILFLLTPISAFAECCESIQPYLRDDTLVVDACSVKVYPVAIMQRVFSPSQPLLATHPLFGPDSVKKSGGLASHTLVICPLKERDEKIAALEAVFASMGLTLMVTTPEEHDKQMASSQGLVHFIGRGLSALDLQPQALATPDFAALLNIHHMVNHDTWQLFFDMHRYNPYVKAIRQKFIQALLDLDIAITEEKSDANHQSIKRKN